METRSTRGRKAAVLKEARKRSVYLSHFSRHQFEHQRQKRHRHHHQDFLLLFNVSTCTNEWPSLRVSFWVSFRVSLGCFWFLSSIGILGGLNESPSRQKHIIYRATGSGRKSIKTCLQILTPNLFFAHAHVLLSCYIANLSAMRHFIETFLGACEAYFTNRFDKNRVYEPRVLLS